MNVISLFEEIGDKKKLSSEEGIKQLGHLCPIVKHYYRVQSFGVIDWPTALALMVWELAKSNENKDEIIKEFLKGIKPVMKNEGDKSL